MVSVYRSAVRGSHACCMCHTALAPEGNSGPGKVEALLDEHEIMNCVGLKITTSKGDGVLPT